MVLSLDCLVTMISLRRRGMTCLRSVVLCSSSVIALDLWTFLRLRNPSCYHLGMLSCAWCCWSSSTRPSLLLQQSIRFIISSSVTWRRFRCRMCVYVVLAFVASEYLLLRRTSRRSNRDHAHAIHFRARRACSLDNAQDQRVAGLILEVRSGFMLYGLLL